MRWTLLLCLPLTWALLSGCDSQRPIDKEELFGNEKEKGPEAASP